MNPEDKKKFKFISLEELTTPHEGDVVFLNRYWLLDEEGRAMIYTNGGAFTPQCNSSEAVAQRGASYSSDYRFIPIAYVNRKFYEIR